MRKVSGSILGSGQAGPAGACGRASAVHPIRARHDAWPDSRGRTLSYALDQVPSATKPRSNE